MKHLLLSFLLSTSLNLRAQSNYNEWSFQRDKQLHTGVGVALGVGLTQLMLSSNLGYDPVDVVFGPQPFIAFVAGTKEVYDAGLGSGVGELSDIVYTMIGGMIGSFVTYSINDAIKKRKKRKTGLKL